jgi:hypothetical protein
VPALETGITSADCNEVRRQGNALRPARWVRIHEQQLHCFFTGGEQAELAGGGCAGAAASGNPQCCFGKMIQDWDRAQKDCNTSGEAQRQWWSAGRGGRPRRPRPAAEVGAGAGDSGAEQGAGWRGITGGMVDVLRLLKGRRLALAGDSVMRQVGGALGSLAQQIRRERRSH